MGLKFEQQTPNKSITQLSPSVKYDAIFFNGFNLKSLKLCNVIKKHHKSDVPIMMLLDKKDAAFKTDACDAGVDQVIVPPITSIALGMQIRGLIEHHRKNRELEDATGILKALSLAVEHYDPYTGGHIERLCNLSGYVAQHMGLSSSDVLRIRIAGLLHDIGKIIIPTSILQKTTELTPEEWDIIKQHPITGANIVSQLHDGNHLAPLVRSHHERFDGLGYPNQLKGHDIPLGGRIIAVVDAYDAMITNRPYRKAFKLKEAQIRLIAGAGTQFDPEIVQKFLELPSRKK
jgi:putative two-component system response regulator